MDPALPEIKAAVKSYFDEAIWLIGDADNIMLRKLQSPDPKAKVSIYSTNILAYPV